MIFICVCVCVCVCLCVKKGVKKLLLQEISRLQKVKKKSCVSVTIYEIIMNIPLNINLNTTDSIVEVSYSEMIPQLYQAALY